MFTVQETESIQDCEDAYESEQRAFVPLNSARNL
jgi:hypothetical protein